MGMQVTHAPRALTACTPTQHCPSLMAGDKEGERASHRCATLQLIVILDPWGNWHFLKCSSSWAQPHRTPRYPAFVEATQNPRIQSCVLVYQRSGDWGVGWVPALWSSRSCWNTYARPVCWMVQDLGLGARTWAGLNVAWEDFLQNPNSSSIIKKVL